MKKIDNSDFPFATIVAIEDGLWAIEELGSTMFLIKGEKKALLIDTAYGLTDMKKLSKALVGEMPVLLVNSHAHGDHNGGNFRFDTLYVGRFDEPNSHEQETPQSRAAILDFMKEKVKAYPFFCADTFHQGPAEKVVPLKEGDCFDLGGVKLTVLETPGHSLGSIALFEEKRGWLFTGDTALTWEVWGQLPGSAALRVYADSLEKLASYQEQVTAVFPAHGLASSPYGHYCLPPRILSVYAQGTRAIVDGKVIGKSYQELQPTFGRGALYVHFEIGGMAYDPNRI